MRKTGLALAALAALGLTACNEPTGAKEERVVLTGGPQEPICGAANKTDFAGCGGPQAPPKPSKPEPVKPDKPPKEPTVVKKEHTGVVYKITVRCPNNSLSFGSHADEGVATNAALGGCD